MLREFNQAIYRSTASLYFPRRRTAVELKCTSIIFVADEFSNMTRVGGVYLYVTNLGGSLHIQLYGANLI